VGASSLSGGSTNINVACLSLRGWRLEKTRGARSVLSGNEMPHAEVMSGPLRRAESGVFAHNVHVEALPSGMDTITLSALESPVAKHRVARSCSFFVTPNDPSVNSRRAAVHSLPQATSPNRKEMSWTGY